MKNIRNMSTMKGASSQQGFTIIELVVVILLLGILTATALPRFMDITDDARDAVADATRGGLRTGVALLRATAIAQNAASGATPSGFEGNLIVDGNGYPAIANGCDTIYNGLLQEGRTLASGSASGTQCTYSLTDVSRTITLETTTGSVN